MQNIFTFVYGHETAKLKGDILEAHEEDVKVIAVDFGYHEKSSLLQAKPAIIVSSFSDLAGAINNV